MMHAVNHLLGDLKAGCILWQPSERTPTSDTAMERSFWVHRHPNTDYLHVLLLCGESTKTTTAKIGVQAGTGTLVETEASSDLVSEKWVELLVPWGASDTGYQEVVITGTDVGFQNVMVHELYRSELSTSDLVVAQYSTSYPAGGLREGRYIFSGSAGIPALLTNTRYAWKYALKNLAKWTGPEYYPVNSTSWTNPFSSQTWTFRARRKNSETTRDHRVYAYTWGAATVTSFEWRMRSNSDTVTSGSLTHTSGAWTGSPLTGLAIDCTTDDTLTFEMRRTGGTGNIHVQRISAPEEIET